MKVLKNVKASTAEHAKEITMTANKRLSILNLVTLSNITDIFFDLKFVI